MKPIRLGALHGLWVFLAYGVVEALFAELVPWVLGRTDVPEWQSSAILLPVYAVAGLIIGAIGGVVVSLLRPTKPERAVRAAAFIGLALLYALNASRISPAIGLVLPLGAALIACSWALLSVRPDIVGDRLGACLGYWPVAFVLAGIPTASIRTGGAVVFLAAVIAPAYFMRNIRFRPLILVAIAISIPLLFFVRQPVLQVPGPELLGPSAASGKPNVILIVLDTVRADHLSLYGYSRKTTPQLEKLAPRATVYTNAISTSDMTLASHASLFTGMYPSRHEAHYTSNSPMGHMLPKGFRTLAEILTDQGYVTAGVAANVAFLQHVYGLDQGFSFWSVRGGFFRDKDGFWLRHGVRLMLGPWISRYKGMTYRRAGEINADVFRMLDSVRGSKRPFFLFVNYMDAHWPYDPPRPFDAFYPRGGPAFSDAAYAGLLQQVMALKHKVTPAERKRLVGPYDGAISYLDSEVGRLIERLKTQGLYENTLLIITADHGETFGERNLLSHSVSVYQDQVHVPLVVKYPNTNRGGVVERVVSGVDMLPTVLDAVGLPVPAGTQGEDLLKTDLSRDVLAESFPNIRYFSLHPRFLRLQRAIFRGSRKLVTSTAGGSQLFDTARDPDELHDLSASESGEVAELLAALDRSLRSAGAGTRFMAQHFSKVEVERLRSLGYVQ